MRKLKVFGLAVLLLALMASFGMLYAQDRVKTGKKAATEVKIEKSAEAAVEQTAEHQCTGGCKGKDKAHQCSGTCKAEKVEGAVEGVEQTAGEEMQHKCSGSCKARQVEGGVEGVEHAEESAIVSETHADKAHKCEGACKAKAAAKEDGKKAEKE